MPYLVQVAAQSLDRNPDLHPFVMYSACTVVGVLLLRGKFPMPLSPVSSHLG